MFRMLLSGVHMRFTNFASFYSHYIIPCRWGVHGQRGKATTLGKEDNSRGKGRQLSQPQLAEVTKMAGVEDMEIESVTETSAQQQIATSSSNESTKKSNSFELPW